MPARRQPSRHRNREWPAHLNTGNPFKFQQEQARESGAEPPVPDSEWDFNSWSERSRELDQDRVEKPVWKNKSPRSKDGGKSKGWGVRVRHQAMYGFAILLALVAGIAAFLYFMINLR